MGKKGDVLRAQRKANARYKIGGSEITGAQLADNNVRLIQEYKKEIYKTAMFEANKAIDQRKDELREVINKEWEERSELFASDDMQSNMFEFTRLTVMIAVKILHEHFGWRPVPDGRKHDGRYKFVRFHDYFAEELNMISDDELIDIRKYSADVEKLVGIDFTQGEKNG